MPLSLKLQGESDMARQQETFGSNAIQMLDPGRIMEAQRAAAENAARVTSTAMRYAMSMNQAWLNLMNNQLTHYFRMPERLAETQRDFIEQAFDQYQESMEQMSGLAMKVQEEAGDAMRETQAAAENTGRTFAGEAKEMGKNLQKDMTKINRPREGGHANSRESRSQRQPQ
jgi:hypothetical protein